MSDVFSRLEEEFQLPSPLQLLETALTKEKRVSLFIKRDDLIHPFVSGNKWRKLKYNITKALSDGVGTLVTFGGAFSNHLVAVAVVGQVVGIPTVGFVRGYKIDEENPTIQFLRSVGMKLELVLPKDYQLKETGEAFSKWKVEHDNYYLIPEGGTNELAIKGVGEIGGEIEGEFTLTYLGIGTAGTLAGIVNSALDTDKIVGVSPFAGAVETLAGFDFIHNWDEVSIVTKVTETKFGSYDASICTFINSFHATHNILLDPIYTGPAMQRLMYDIANEVVPKESTVLFIHTGGLQGNIGYNYRFGKKMSEALQIPEFGKRKVV